MRSLKVYGCPARSKPFRANYVWLKPLLQIKIQSLLNVGCNTARLSLEINFVAKSSNPLKRVESHTESSKDDFSFKPELQFRATIIFLTEQY